MTRNGMLGKWLAGALTALTMVTAAGSCVVRGRATWVVESEPPPPQQEEIPQARMGYVWIHGHWQYQGNQWVWTEGYWEQPRVGYVYVQPRWTRQGRGWVYAGGGWRQGGGQVYVQGRGRAPRGRGTVVVQPPRGGVEVRGRGTVEVR